MGSRTIDAQAGAVARVTRRAAERVRAGHLWVYRSDVEALAPAVPRKGETDGEEYARLGLVTVVDGRGIPLGTGLYSSASEIAIRMVSRRPGLDRTEYLAEVRQRVETALALRRRLIPEAFAHLKDARTVEGADAVPYASSGSFADGQTDACRLIFSEADELPGIVVDRYAELIVMQLLIQGTAQEDLRRLLVEVLGREGWARTIVERPDPRVRQLERLEDPAAGAIWRRAAPPAASTDSGLTANAPSSEAEERVLTVFSLNGLRFHFDADAGQKTGAFLDQRESYAAAARWATAAGKTGRALDICTYQGGFALHLARVCKRVTGVDASRAALEVADRNLELNADQISARVDWIEADAFDLLRDYEAAGETFDTVVLDPPAFAKSKRAAEGALRGYKELNLRALKMLAPGGTLVTCSCSHHVALDEFTGVVRAAAEDAGRRVQLLDTRGAAPDHPAILTLPETGYLKCLICRVV